MSTLPIEQRTLDTWAEFAETVRDTSVRVQVHLAKRKLHTADVELQILFHAAAAVFVSMQRAGAQTPDCLPPAAVPLHMLDTPANRRLARALRDAYEAAVEVDRERGTYTEGEPEDGPTAMPIVELLVRVEEECFGPAGCERG